MVNGAYSIEWWFFDLINHVSEFWGVELAVVHTWFGIARSNNYTTRNFKYASRPDIDSASPRRLAAYLNLSGPWYNIYITTFHHSDKTIGKRRLKLDSFMFFMFLIHKNTYDMYYTLLFIYLFIYLFITHIEHIHCKRGYYMLSSIGI